MENNFIKKSTFFKLLSVAFVLCAFTWSALAQNVIVKGVVKDTDGQTVIGASVLQKGTLNGVTTDSDGAFQLTVPSNATLQVSFIGYKTVEVAVNNRSTINVTLEEDREMLEETVVIGYGTAKRSDVTGSISSVNQEVLRQIPAGDITTALQGRIAGVEMRQTSATPGASMRIRIRGTRSLSASNDPLIVLDGIPYSGNLQDISTDDVKSIDILKDASSTAIYGSRGANGVIMITTEHGQQGQPARVNFSSFAAYKDWIKYPFMNTEQYGTMRDLAKKYNDTVDEDRSVDTDWQDIYFEPGFSIQNNLTVTGGTNGGHYSFGVNYFKDESNIPTEGFDRINVRASLDQGIGKYFTFGFTTNLGLNKNYGNAGGAQIELTPMINPWIDPALGNVSGNTRREGLLMPKDNNYIAKTRSLMYDVADQNLSINKRYTAYTSGYMEVEAPFLKGLKYRLNAGANIRILENGSYRGKGILSNIPTNPSSASRYWGNSTNWTLENLLTFNRTFNDVHNLSLTAMFSAEKTTDYRTSYSIQGVGADFMQFYQMGYYDNITMSPGNQTYQDYGLMSWMGRAMYTYANKYMITAMVRGDGSSRLAEGRKWHTYPAVSVGWNISNEDFMDNVTWIDMLKLRAGYGQTSNQAIAPYATLGQLSTSPYNFGYSGDYQLGYYVSSLPNTNLGWEYSETWNFGVDYGMFNGRLSGTIEYYHVLTTDLLQNVSLPPTAGVGSYTANVGKTKNDGLEFTINGTIIQHRGDGFNWTAGLNVSRNHNEILELASGAMENRSNNWYVGYPVNSFRDYVYEGIWQADEEAAMKIAEGGNVGMIKVKYLGDYDANGLPTRQVGDDDKIVQSNEALLMGGFNTMLTWKGFDFQVIGNYQIGGIYTSSTHYSYTNQLSGRRGNLLVDYWTPENTGAHWPAPGGVAENDDSPRHQGAASRYSGTNVMISTITLGYNFSNIKAVKNFGLRNCRLYATVQNPFVLFSPFYKATGIRPTTNNGAFGVSAAGTPNTINYLLGLNLSF